MILINSRYNIQIIKSCFRCNYARQTLLWIIWLWYFNW